MITLRFTEDEINATLFAMKSDHETIINSPGIFDDDEPHVRSVIEKIERANKLRVLNEQHGRAPIPCPVCEMNVNVGLGSADGTIKVATDSRGYFAGAVAIHNQCESKFKGMKY